MDGFVAVTDPEWWEQLAREPGSKDANFWRPSARAFRLPIGTPFFFKLKAPHNAIAGFGYFAGFSVLPDWLVLRSDLHRLFDHGYVTVDEDNRLVVGRRLKDEFENGRTYYDLHGRQLALPTDAALRPAPEALEWHRQAFLG